MNNLKTASFLLGGGIAAEICGGFYDLKKLIAAGCAVALFATFLIYFKCKKQQ